MKLKTAQAVMSVLFTICCVSMALLILTEFALFSYTAIVAIIAYGIINLVFWRCPNCGECIGTISIRKYNHCRCCGKEIKL